MRLKKIKLAGFKSFVEPTTIPFPGEMTAVVGPNGCGKSNVIDAVRWVLGESSAKNLRGDAMTDVIFNGSSARKALSQCSVELTFDNASGRIGGEFANYNELSVKRVVTKDAVSNYLLNGTKCRKRDITDLFLGTGLGPRSYAIIEQGMISKLIESRPQELRVFVEEAAGISKYKERRRETENRIKHTKENLARLDDLRNELAQQLSKLQRQATSANRYKELKATERELKGQLSVVRWVRLNEVIETAHQVIAEKQTELDRVMAKKEADQSKVLEYRNEQANFKVKINDIQQDIFKLSTEITKIEQSQLFSKKRKQQIEMELQQLQVQATQIDIVYKDTATELTTVEMELVGLAPNKMVLEAQVDEAQHLRQAAELSLSQFNDKNRDSESQYHSVKQQQQQTQSQIEHTTGMQARTNARLTELNIELENLSSNELEAQCDQMQTELILAKDAAKQSNQDCVQIEQQHARLITARNEADAVLEHNQTSLISVNAQIEALESLHCDASHNMNTHADAFELDTRAVALCDYLKIESGFEGLFDIVLANMSKPMLLASLNITDIPRTFFEQQKGQVVFLEAHMTEKKQQGSLAQKLHTQYVPSIFNVIKLVESASEAFDLQPSLLPGHSVISHCGIWLFRDMLFNGLGANVDNTLSRAADIKALKTQHLSQSERVALAKESLLSADQQVKDTGLSLKDATLLRTGYEEQVFKLSTQLSQLQQQASHEKLRHERLLQERERYQKSEQEECDTLERLHEQHEQYTYSLVEFESFIEQQVEKSEHLHNNLSLARAEVEKRVAQSHELALKMQQTKNTYQLLKEKQSSREAQISDNKEKIELLQEEAEELSLPFENQQSHLQSLLQSKETLQAKQREIERELGELDEALLKTEKGHSTIDDAARLIKSDIDNLLLQVEGNKVRAQAFLEQIHSLQQPLHVLLADLPDDIDDALWEQKLTQTGASLSRLGAVNLAAVEEFDSQSKRKHYLDEQNTDLTQALDTLENAIKKIDKETRSRFKSTFDQINADLKMLFPKVFGGGSAHLALTEDDMLDTGVTIMARPPGKKNSTIHLLSGGEKALTALSLVFAIFRLNPAPFCLLDEVDAPLDDANVARFCKLVSEMSKTVQFIYITHNKVAMEMASHLTGVTMSEPGVSRMVAVDVDEALAIAE